MQQSALLSSVHALSPLAMGSIRWGICSAGKISHDFVVALKTLPPEDHQVVWRKRKDATVWRRVLRTERNATLKVVGLVRCLEATAPAVLGVGTGQGRASLEESGNLDSLRSVRGRRLVPFP